MTISLDSLVSLSENQISADFSTADPAVARSEVVVLNLDDGQYFELNEVGASVWQLLQEPVRVDEVLARLLEEYEVSNDECETDLLELLGDLEEHGLITVS